MIPSMTAYHEAGHLVAASLLGLGTTSATVVKKGANLGLVRFKDATATFAADRVKARKLIVATLAARAAVGRIYADGGAGCGADDESVWALARGILGDDPAHAAEVGVLVRECWEEARDLVDDHSQAVGDVARTLDRVGTLTGEEIERWVGQAVERDRDSPTMRRHRETKRAFWRWVEEQQQGGNSDSND